MIEEKLKLLKIILPIPPKPIGSYVPVAIIGKTAYVSGQIPIRDGILKYKGKVPKEQSVEESQEAAKLCIINGLAQLKSQLGNLDRITRIIKISGYVNSAPDFKDQPLILNAASDLLYEIFGESGRHSRLAVGVNSLPLDSTVELDMIVEIT